MASRKKEPIEPWIWGGREVLSLDDFPNDAYGFIYEIVHKETGQRYIGKKQLYSYHKKATKVFNEKTKRWNKAYETVATESNWQKYFGSSKEIADLVKKEGKDKFNRYIIDVAYSKKTLTYLEMHWQCQFDVLREPDYINSNILGKFFRSDFS